MKITQVQVIFLEKQLAATMQISRGGFRIRQHAIIRVDTDAGIYGLGEGIGNARLVKAIVEAQMGEAARGLDPFNLETLREKLMAGQVYYENKGSAICAASGIEMACWDIMAKALKVPCYQLMGGLYRKELPAYASDVYWEEDPARMADNARRIASMGYRIIKAHIGYRPPEDDLKRVKALREAIGDQVKLMIDLNAGYNFYEARQAMKLWEPYNLAWLEEPLPPDQTDALAELRRVGNIPIAAGENEFRVAGFNALFERHAVDVAMPDIGRAGGLLETKQICALAKTKGVPVSPHNFSSGVLLAATMHLMASTPNVMWLEVDTSKNAVYEELFTQPLVLKEGAFTIPDSPGLGVEIPAEIERKYRIN